MKKSPLNLTAALLLAALPLWAAPKAAPKAQKKYTAGAAPQQAAPAAPAAPAVSTAPVITDIPVDIKKGLIEVFTPVNGVTTAHETYDIYAPFDGRLEELRAELFNFVTPQTVLGRMVSNEMAALLDSSSEGNRKQTERRWQDVYKFYDIKPEFQGIVTNVYAAPRTQVYKGDRLFTISRKVIVIGKNTRKLYSAMAPDMTAEVKHFRTGEAFSTRLTNFIPLKDSKYFNRLWLEVTDLKQGIRVGEQFDGTLLIGRNPDARIVPRRDLLQINGKKYLLLEVQTGLMTEEEAEITRVSERYLRVDSQDWGAEDGSQKK